jgi:hypothetical protein
MLHLNNGKLKMKNENVTIFELKNAELKEFKG